ncbi:MAG TPA: ParA family protein [Anaerolineales bacterium]|jgi:chromosome partitioning protein
MTTIIAVSNEKGGVAKTTTTLSLGAALAELGQRVLLIDLDPQANLSLALGIEVGPNESSAGNVLIESAPLLGAARPTTVENIRLIPCNSKVEAAEQYLPMRTGYISTLRRAIHNAGSLDCEYVLIDCPPALGAITLNALSAADLLIIPTQAEYFSAYALRNMMSMIRRVRQETNPSLAYRILVTMFDRRNRTHRNISDQLRGTFGAGVFNTIIEVDTKLRESPIAAVPITQYKPNTRGSLQYRVLAQELVEYAKETSEARQAS